MRGSRIYIDVDDVLAETTRALAALARERFAKDVAFEAMHTFDLGVSLGLDMHELPRFMDAAHAPDFLAGLDPIAGARETVQGLADAGAEIHVVTGRPPSTRAVTARWLAQAGIPHARLDMVDKYHRHPEADAVPREVLLERRYAFVIEDSAEIASLMAAQTTTRVLLFDRPWNRPATDLHPRVERVFGWQEIEALVIGAR
jgi:uncharacterized HAD superfamily protein